MSIQTNYSFHLLEPYLFFDNYSNIKYDDIKEHDKFTCIYKLLQKTTNDKGTKKTIFEELLRSKLKMDDESISLLKNTFNTDTYYGNSTDINTKIKDYDILINTVGSNIAKNVCYLSKTANTYIVTNDREIIIYNHDGLKKYLIIEYNNGILEHENIILSTLNKSIVQESVKTVKTIEQSFLDRLRNETELININKSLKDYEAMYEKLNSSETEKKVDVLFSITNKQNEKLSFFKKYIYSLKTNVPVSSRDMIVFITQKKKLVENLTKNFNELNNAVIKIKYSKKNEYEKIGLINKNQNSTQTLSKEIDDRLEVLKNITQQSDEQTSQSDPWNRLKTKYTESKIESKIKISDNPLDGLELYEYVIKNVCKFVSNSEPILFTKIMIVNYATNLLEQAGEKCSFDGVMLEVFLDRLRYFTTNFEENKYYDKNIYDGLKDIWFNVNKLYYSGKSLQLPENFSIIKPEQQSSDKSEIMTFPLNLEGISFQEKYDELNSILNIIYGTVLEDISLENAENYVNLNITFMEKAIDLLYRYTMTDVTYWILLTGLVKIPMNIYNALINIEIDNFDKSNQIAEKLSRLFKQWLSETCESNLCHIYKYAYYLVMHKLIHKYTKDVGVRSSIMYNEFISNCGAIELFDNDILFDINVIKSSILTTKPIWFENTDDYIKILEIMYESLLIAKNKIDKNIDTKILAESLLKNINIETALLEKKEDEKVISANIKNFENPEIGWLDPTKLLCETNESRIQSKINTYPVYFDHKCMLFYFPCLDQSLSDKFSFELRHDSLALLLQFINVCKMENVKNANFPCTIPCEATMTVSNKQNNDEPIYLKNDAIRYTVKDINIQSRNPKEYISTDKNINGNEYGMKSIYEFVKFVQTRDIQYLNNIFPFIKIGFGLKTLSDEINLSEKDIVITKNNILQYDTNPLRTYSNDTIFSNDDLYTNFTKLMNINDLKLAFNTINKSSMNKKYYNIFIFIYLLLTNDSNVNDIDNSKLFTAKDLENSHLNICEKLCAFSNAIKFYTINDTIKCMDYLKLLNSYVSKEKINENLEKIGKTKLTVDDDYVHTLQNICVIKYDVPWMLTQYLPSVKTKTGKTSYRPSYKVFLTAIENGIRKKTTPKINVDIDGSVDRRDPRGMTNFAEKLFGKYDKESHKCDGSIIHTDDTKDFDNKMSKYFTHRTISLIENSKMQEVSSEKERWKNRMSKFSGGAGAKHDQDDEIMREVNSNLASLNKKVTKLSDFLILNLLDSSILNNNSFHRMIKNFIRIDNENFTKKGISSCERKNNDNKPCDDLYCENKFLKTIAYYITKYARDEGKSATEIIEKIKLSDDRKQILRQFHQQSKSPQIADKLSNFNWSLFKFLTQEYISMRKGMDEMLTKIYEGLELNVVDPETMEDGKQIERSVIYYPTTSLTRDFYFYIGIGSEYTSEKCEEIVKEKDNKMFIEIVDIKKRPKYVREFVKIKECDGEIILNKEEFFMSEKIKFPIIHISKEKFSDRKFDLGEIFMQHIALFINKSKKKLPGDDVSGFIYNGQIGEIVKPHCDINQNIKSFYLKKETSKLAKIYFNPKYLHNILSQNDLFDLLKRKYGHDVLFNEKTGQFIHIDDKKNHVLVYTIPNYNENNVDRTVNDFNKSIAHITSDSKYKINITMKELYVPEKKVKRLLSSIKINDDTFSEKGTDSIHEYLETFLTGYVKDGMFIMYTPEFVTNYRLISEFDWDEQNIGKYIIKRHNQKHVGYNLRSNGVNIYKQMIDGKDTDEMYVSLDKLFTSPCYEKMIPFVHNLLFVTKPNNIMIWESNGQISNIDILLWDYVSSNNDENPNINFNFLDNRVKINNEHFIENSDQWTIQRWVANMPNMFMIRDKSNNYMMYLLPVTKIKYDIRAKCKIDQMLFNKEISDSSKDERDKLLLDGLKKFRIIQFNSLTHMPIISDADVLRQLCLSYACFNEVGNIFELGNLIRKLKVDLKTDKSNLFINEIDFTEYPKDKPLVFSSRYRIPSFARVKAKILTSVKQEFSYIPKNKFSLEKSYEHVYQFYESVDNFDEYVKNYYFQSGSEYVIPTLAEYYSYSLMQFKQKTSDGTKTVSDYVFSLLFNRLRNNYKNYPEDLQNEFKILIGQMNGKFRCNPLEFFYQCVVGYLARDKQKELVQLIIDDISDEQVQNMTGGYKMFTDFVYGDFSYVNKEHGRGTIHNLLMGQGKTKMITPLVILRYLQQRGLYDMKHGMNGKNHIYLILPENLVYQSYSFLSSTLSMYFPVNVQMISESRKDDERGYTQSLENPVNSDLELQLYVMSDTTMKCGMINQYKLISNNANKHCYLFDEIDTVLDPTVSELNYPHGKKLKLKGLDEFFDVVYDSLYDIFIEHSKEIKELLSKSEYKSDWTNAPHFNIINMSSKLVGDLVNYVKGKLLHNFSNNKNITDGLTFDFKNYNKSDNEISVSDKERLNALIREMTDGELQIIMSLHNLLNDVLPMAFSFINRKNYGLDNCRGKNPIIVPFSYADKPMTGSNFSNPMFVLVLTMLNYMIQLTPLENMTVNNMIKLMKKRYDSIPYECKKNSDIALEYDKLKIVSTNLEELMDIGKVSILSDNDIAKIRVSHLFAKMICKFNCEEYIEFNPIQDNISGVDLMMSFNASHRSGFTGTPNIPKFFDIDPNGKLDVREESKETTEKINGAFKLSTVKVYDDNDAPLEYFKQILADNLDCNVIIDSGSVLVGTTSTQIYEEILQKHSKLEQFIFWNNKDISMVKDNNGIETQWNGVMTQKDNDLSNNMFYYYDNRHTTGTDAIIPIGSKGLVLLGKNSRYRDVVQSMYRMRKLGIGHTVTFVLNKKIKHFINNKYSENIDKEITIEILQKWFDDEESNYLVSQQKLMNTQNILALGRSKVFRNENEEYFRMRNVFTYPVINELKTESLRSQACQLGNIITQKSLDVENVKQRIVRVALKNNMKEISDLVNKDGNMTSSYGISMVMEQQQEKEQQQEQNKSKNKEQQINIPLGEQLTPNINIISNKSIEDYFNKTNEIYYNEFIKDFVYVSKNIYLKNKSIEDNLYFGSPYIVIYVNEIFYIVPFLEGYKIFDTINNNLHSIQNAYLIFDSIGLIYRSTNLTKENNNIIKTIGLFLIKKLDENVYISMNDYIAVFTMLKAGYLKTITTKIIEYINSMKSDSSIFVSFKKSINIYINSMDKINLLVNKYNLEENKKMFYESLKETEIDFMRFFTCNGNVFGKIEF
jgi:hypothetical protein